MSHSPESIVESRRPMFVLTAPFKRSEESGEGGCSGLRFAANISIAARHVRTASKRMHTRGNGTGGVFVIPNGAGYTDIGKLVELPTPDRGSNHFALVADGAIFLRDPPRWVEEDQFNGGTVADAAQADWDLMRPDLFENEVLSGLTLADLLAADGGGRSPESVYRNETIHTDETSLVETKN